jgi:Nickel/cobalt transporter regulator
MLRSLAIAAMLALLLPGLAAAQQKDDKHGGHPPPGHPSGPAPSGPVHPAFKSVIVPKGSPTGPVGGLQHNPAFIQHPPGSPPGPIGGLHPGPAFGQHLGGPPGPPIAYRGRNIERVHVHPFVYPQGYGYQRWAIGARLPPIFFTPDYYYADWAALGLDPPPPGYQWVRYGPDMLLVELDDGQVVDVVYDVFYD